MAVTDLTGTKWYFNDDPIYSDSVSYAINFVSNENNATKITFNYIKNRISYAGIGIVYDDGWSNEAFRTIEITGGTDVTNSALIAWLQANATQIQEQTNSISFGNLPIANMYFGTRQVKKVYLGNTLVWEKEESGYTVTLNYSGANENYTAGRIYVYDGSFDVTQDPSSQSNLIFSQNPLDLSAYPVALTIKSGYCTVLIDADTYINGRNITSNDFTEYTEGIAAGGVGEFKTYHINKNGTIIFSADDWDG